MDWIEEEVQDSSVSDVEQTRLYKSIFAPNSGRQRELGVVSGQRPSLDPLDVHRQLETLHASAVACSQY